MVWHQGAAGWVAARHFPELQLHLHCSPPPIQQLGHNALEVEMREMLSATKPRKPVISLALAIAAMFLVSILSYINYRVQAAKYTHIQERLDAQEDDIDEQEALTTTLIQQQNQIDAARQVIANSQQVEILKTRKALALKGLQEQYQKSLERLAIEQMKLSEIKEFQLLRTKAQKQEQLALQQELIRATKHNIAKLQAQIAHYQ
ncbi:MAG: hypothetical protein IT256_01380 [Chitinophagaceae bacterium]|nr:hypothetical protein [Chitinophagaceae bacterium]